MHIEEDLKIMNALLSSMHSDKKRHVEVMGWD
jgi:hypothetical protein